MRSSILLPLSAVLLAACATTPTAEVTRFHLGQPIARSTVALIPADGSQPSGLEFRSYADAVARELQAQSFVVVPNPAEAAYVGTLTVSQDARPGARRGGLSIGLGGGGFSGGRGGGGVGLGGSVGIPITGGRPTEIRATTLGLQLKRRSDNTVIWEGRAIGEAQGPAGDASSAVPQLARALLSGFPGARGQTVRVKLR